VTPPPQPARPPRTATPATQATAKSTGMKTSWSTECPGCCRRGSPQRRPRSQSEASPPDVRRFPSRNAPPARQEEGLGYGISSGSTNEIPAAKASTPPVRQTETIAARTRVAQDRERGKAEPQRRCRSSRRAASEHHVKHRHDRQQRDQQVNSTCGRDVRFGSRAERTPPPRFPPPPIPDPPDPSAGRFKTTRRLCSGSPAHRPRSGGFEPVTFGFRM